MPSRSGPNKGEDDKKPDVLVAFEVRGAGEEFPFCLSTVVFRTAGPPARRVCRCFVLETADRLAILVLPPAKPKSLPFFHTGEEPTTSAHTLCTHCHLDSSPRVPKRSPTTINRRKKTVRLAAGFRE